MTLGVTVFTWVELLAEWAQLARHAPDLRRALPTGFASRAQDRDALVAGLRTAISRLEQLTDFDDLIANFAERIRSVETTSAEFRASARDDGS